jgi:hypothetical protein
MDDSMQPSGVTSVTADVHTEGLHCGQPSGSFEKSSHDAPVRLTQYPVSSMTRDLYSGIAVMPGPSISLRQ